MGNTINNFTVILDSKTLYCSVLSYWNIIPEYETNLKLKSSNGKNDLLLKLEDVNSWIDLYFYKINFGRVTNFFFVMVLTSTNWFFFVPFSIILCLGGLFW